MVEASHGVPAAARAAGALLALVGAANAVLGLLALTSDLVRLGPAVSGGLVLVGVVTAALGALVWRGSRIALTAALTVLGLLLIVQLGDLAAAGSAHDALPRLAVLTLLVAALGVAQLSGRRAASR